MRTALPPLAALSVILTLPLGACAQSAKETRPMPDKKTAAAEIRVGAGGREMAWTGAVSEEAFKALHELKTGEAPELHGTMIDLAGGRAYLSLPTEGEAPFPAIVVIQEWWGLNDNIKLWSDRLAADGYAALAVDLYDGTIATTPDEAMAAMQKVEDARALEILKAGFDFLGADPRVKATKRGCIGWCFGGGWSLQLSLNEPALNACVMYYGRPVDDPAELKKMKAPLLGVFGNEDTGIPSDMVDTFEKALQEAVVDYQIHRYDAAHAFANPSSARYDEAAAGRAWSVVTPFLAYHLKQ